MFFFKNRQIPLSDFFPDGYIDIHSHLLPGIDDGAQDLNNSIQLILRMKSYGIKNFITTPHIFSEIYPNTPKIIKHKLNEVKEELEKRNITNISIDAAAEYMIDETFSALLEDDKEILTLKDNLVLVEMSYFSPPRNLFEILFLLGIKGYKPVLAHPERYITYHNNFRIYQKLKNVGCLFQLNLLSLSENYGKGVQKTTEKLLKENMYDFVGSDAHNFNHLDYLQKISTSKNLLKLESLFLNNKKFLKS